MSSCRTVPTWCSSYRRASGMASCCRRIGRTLSSEPFPVVRSSGRRRLDGFADPDAKIGFGYVMYRIGSHILLDPRAIALIDAAYASL